MTNKTLKEIFTCLHCGNKTMQTMICRHNQKVPLGVYSHSGSEIEAENYLLFFVCSTCDEVTIKSLFSEDIEDPNEVNMERVKTLYPNQKAFPDNMPKEIVAIYQEAIKVKKVSPISFTILIRKALEALCEDQKAKGSGLKQKIIFLSKTMKLPEKFIEMIDSIRLIGNKSAHEIDFSATKEHVNSLDYFFIAIIEYIYIAPHRIAEIRKSLKK